MRLDFVRRPFARFLRGEVHGIPDTATASSRSSSGAYLPSSSESSFSMQINSFTRNSLAPSHARRARYFYFSLPRVSRPLCFFSLRPSVSARSDVVSRGVLTRSRFDVCVSIISFPLARSRYFDESSVATKDAKTPAVVKTRLTEKEKEKCALIRVHRNAHRAE